MKRIKIIAFLLMSSVITFYGCKEEKPATQQEQNFQPIDFSNSSATPNGTSANSVQNTAGVYHYTCSNGCAGGSASAGTCPSCGNTLAHNAAYHANTNNATPTSPFTTPTPANTGANTAGVYHYTCGNGCSGGAASPGSCSNCGGDLAHNTAYHQ